MKTIKFNNIQLEDFSDVILDEHGDTNFYTELHCLKKKIFEFEPINLGKPHFYLNFNNNSNIIRYLDLCYITKKDIELTKNQLIKILADLETFDKDLDILINHYKNKFLSK